jgi:hypothetical protein
MKYRKLILCGLLVAITTSLVSCGTARRVDRRDDRHDIRDERRDNRW